MNALLREVEVCTSLSRWLQCMPNVLCEIVRSYYSKLPSRVEAQWDQKRLIVLDATKDKLFDISGKKLTVNSTIIRKLIPKLGEAICVADKQRSFLKEAIYKL